MAGHAPSDTLTDTRLEGLDYLYRNGVYLFADPIEVGRSYGNAFADFQGPWLEAFFPGARVSSRVRNRTLKSWSYRLTAEGKALVEYLRAVRKSQVTV